MCLHHHVADDFIAVLLRHFPCGKEVAQGFGHLLVVDVDIAVVHPVVCKGLAVGSLALCDLVLVVREDQILTAAVEVEGLAQVVAGHGRAFNVPARSALAPWRIPVGFTRFRCLPDSEVQRFLLAVVDVDSCACLQFLNGLTGQLAVFRERRGPEVYVSVVSGISVTGVHQLFHNVNDKIHAVGDGGVYIRIHDVQSVCIGLVFRNIALGDLCGSGSLFVCLFDDLVVHVSEILHIGDSVAPVFQIAAQHVKCTDGTGVSDMDIVVYRRTAGIDADVSGLNGNDLFFFSCQRIIDLHDD